MFRRGHARVAGDVSVALALVLLTGCGGAPGTRADGGDRHDAVAME